MAERHAGFALVTCVGESLVNSLVEAAFIAHPELTSVTVPAQLDVGGIAVTFQGEVRLLPPVVTLRPGVVDVRVRALAEGRMSAPGMADQDVLVDLSTTVGLAPVVFVQGDRLQVGIDPRSVVVSNLQVSLVAGTLPGPYGNAWRLPAVAAAVQAAVNALPQSALVATADGFPLTTDIAPRQMPCGASLFELPEMFHATFSISRVVPLVLAGVLVIGVDIAGISNGDPARLRSLFGDVRPVWVRTGGQEGTVGFDRKSFRGSGNLCTSVNPDALAALLGGPISNAVNHAFIDCHVALESIGVGAETFSPPLQPQYRIDGLRFSVAVRYYQSTARDAQSRLVPAGSGTPVSVSFPFAVHRQTWDGPTAFLSGKRDYWYMQAYEPDIDLPWWVSLGLLFIGSVLPGAFVPQIALLDGVLPGVLGNVTHQVQKSAQAGISGAWASLELDTSGPVTLPGLEGVPARFHDSWYAMDGQGIDVYTTLGIAAPDTRRDRHLVVTVFGTQVPDGATWSIIPRTTPSTRFQVRVKDGVADANDPHVRIAWEVRRTDTGAVVLTQDLPRRSFLTSVGGGVLGGASSSATSPTRIDLDRTDPALASATGFEVSLRVYRPLLGRTKEIGAWSIRLPVEDRLDRSHPYVWWGGWANGYAKESVLHRTAAPGRCLMVERAPNDTRFQYVDQLPFPVEELALHRGGTEAERRSHIVCDYCFFGGPDKTVPLI